VTGVVVVARADVAGRVEVEVPVPETVGDEHPAARHATRPSRRPKTRRPVCQDRDTSRNVVSRPGGARVSTLEREPSPRRCSLATRWLSL
jgi:hypothetical protein